MCRWNEKCSTCLWKGNSALSFSKHLFSLQHLVFMNGTFPPKKRAADSKSLTSLEHDKSGTHISVGKAINFTPACARFLLLLKAFLFVWRHSFWHTPFSSFRPLSTSSRHKELRLQWTTSRSAPANVQITAKYWLWPTNGSGPLSPLRMAFPLRHNHINTNVHLNSTILKKKKKLLTWVITEFPPSCAEWNSKKNDIPLAGGDLCLWKIVLK